MKVSVVYAMPSEQVWIPVEVDDEATLLTAIHQSDILNMFPDIQLDTQKVGVFGRIKPLDNPLAPETGLKFTSKSHGNPMMMTTMMTNKLSGL